MHRVSRRPVSLLPMPHATARLCPPGSSGHSGACHLCLSRGLGWSAGATRDTKSPCTGGRAEQRRAAHAGVGPCCASPMDGAPQHAARRVLLNPCWQGRCPHGHRATRTVAHSVWLLPIAYRRRPIPLADSILYRQHQKASRVTHVPACPSVARRVHPAAAKTTDTSRVTM